ncbi:MAG TPA: glycosyl hydrolase 53 family protein [Verrucomicrobiae bacterium]|nr:glycosyl hydrolase 53 family protein [Verrucomicrobiae bacterium]
MQRIVWSLLVAGIVVATSHVSGAEFIAGADMSHLPFFESRGVVYRDNGQARDALDLLKVRGINCVRLRLFTSSAAQAANNPYNYINNLDYTLPLAIRAKNAGFQILLDFHYSDTWADPGHQQKPAAWSGLTFSELVQQMRSYNSNTIAAFDAAGVMPEYVQVGNEITGGMLFPDGANTNSSQWNKLAQLMSAAINGIKDAAGTNMPKIVVHIDRGARWDTTQWFFDNLAQRSVPFDIIGQSYYPWWHGTLPAFENCLTNTVRRFNKPVLIAETAFPWTNSTNIFGIPATTNGQVEFVAELAKIIKRLPPGKAAGVVWWGTEYQQVNGVPTASFQYKSFFRTGGNILPVAAVFGQLAAPAQLQAAADPAGLRLEWPVGGAGMELRSASGLDVADNWSPVTNPVQSAGGTFSTVVPLESGQRFFRLEKN